MKWTLFMIYFYFSAIQAKRSFLRFYQNYPFLLIRRYLRHLASFNLTIAGEVFPLVAFFFCRVSDQDIPYEISISPPNVVSLRQWTFLGQRFPHFDFTQTRAFSAQFSFDVNMFSSPHVVVHISHVYTIYIYYLFKK